MNHRILRALVGALTVGGITCAFAQSPPSTQPAVEPWTGAQAPSGLTVDFAAIPTHPDPAFTFQSRARTSGTVTVLDMKMVSQEWHGAAWSHDIQIQIPAHSSAPDLAVIYIGGLPKDESLDKAVAATGIACATLGGIPGKLPPQLDRPGADLMNIALAQFLATSDPTWIPIYPMTVGLIRAMDAIEAGSAKNGTPIRRFILIGWSKLGYTAWMAAASDPRVVGIVPFASQTLNLTKQASSPASMFNTQRFQSILKTPGGDQLTTTFDPYTYRRKLTMPKLDVAGTMDHNYPTTAMSDYWDGLPGENHALVLANVGHDVGPDPKTIHTMYAFIRSVAAGKPMPMIKASISPMSGKMRLHVSSDVGPREALAWTANAPSADLRAARWTSKTIDESTGEAGKATAGGHQWDAQVDIPAKGSAGLFVELEFEDQGNAYSLTTPMFEGPPNQ